LAWERVFFADVAAPFFTCLPRREGIALTKGRTNLAMKAAKIIWLALVFLQIPIFLLFLPAFQTTGSMSGNPLAFGWASLGMLHMGALVASFSLHILFNTRLFYGWKWGWLILIWFAIVIWMSNLVFLSYYWLKYVWRSPPDSSSDLQASPS